MKTIVTFMLLLTSTALWAEERPNILFFLVDDMGVGDTSVPFLYKDGEAQKIGLNNLYRTPNMEKLAESGLLNVHEGGNWRSGHWPSSTPRM